MTSHSALRTPHSALRTSQTSHPIVPMRSYDQSATPHPVLKVGSGKSEVGSIYAPRTPHPAPKRCMPKAWLCQRLEKCKGVKVRTPHSEGIASNLPPQNSGVAFSCPPFVREQCTARQGNDRPGTRWYLLRSRFCVRP